MNSILYMNVNLLRNKTLFDKGMSMISADRRKKIQNFQNAEPARLSLGAGMLLQIALDKNGYGHLTNAMKYGEHGKPYFENIDFYFNLSHSGEYVICAYGNIPLGVDLQKIKEKTPDKTKKILSGEELIYLDHLDNQMKNQSFYRIWARKESLIKYDGRGLRIPLNEHAMTTDTAFKKSIVFEGKNVYFQEFEFLMPEYTISVCSEKECIIENIIEIKENFLTKY